MLYLTVMLVFLSFASVAMTVNEGLWNNAITLFCITLGGLFGILGGVPLGTWLLAQTDKPPTAAWHFVLAGIWGVFFLSVLVMRLATGSASAVRVRFLPLVDNIGGPIMGLFVAVMLASFTAYTLLHVPIKAEEWRLKTAARWQVSVFQYAQAPFWNVLKNFVTAEEADADFFEFDE